MWLAWMVCLLLLATGVMGIHIVVHIDPLRGTFDRPIFPEDANIGSTCIVTSDP